MESVESNLSVYQSRDGLVRSLVSRKKSMTGRAPLSSSRAALGKISLSHRPRNDPVRAGIFPTRGNAMADTLRRLLVIEDSDGDVFLIKRALQENNIPVDVTVCRDGESALRHLNLSEVDSPPDAIIIDLALPRIEGLDVLHKILNRPAYVGTPIMVFTSSPSPSDKHRVELLAGARYVQKPSGLESFLREVAENVKSMFAERKDEKGSKRT